MKLSCEIIQDLLPLYCDGVCSEESKRKIEEHLQDCDKCRKDMRLMKNDVGAASVRAKDERIAQAAASAWKKGKTRAFIRGCAIAVLTMLVLAVGYTAVHWFTTVDKNDLNGLARQAADYLDYDTLFIEEVEQRGNYLAALCRDTDGVWCMCVFLRDSVFENRWYANGGKPALETGIDSWNYGSPDNEAVLIFCGGDIPEEVCWYTFQNSRITYICPVEDATLLDVFVIPDNGYNINGDSILLDGNQQEIR